MPALMPPSRSWRSLGLTMLLLDNLIPVEQEVQTTDGKWYSLRILPYCTLDNNIAGW